jgi:hypothetical protein
MSKTVKTERRRRATILRALSHGSRFSADDWFIRAALRGFGYRCSKDTVRSDLIWLQDQGFLTTEFVVGHMIATLVERGLAATYHESGEPRKLRCAA